MKKTKLKVFIVLAVLIVFTLSLVSAGYADGQKKMLEAWYGLSNITYNGQDLTEILQPFAAEETTYVPLRKIAEVLNLDIAWEQDTHTVLLSDKSGQSVSELAAQLAIKDAENQQLKSENESLKKKLEKAEEVNSLDELENKLNSQYNEYEDVKFIISLSGDEDEIVVKVYVDLDEYEDEWDDLSTNDQIEYLQDLVDRILDEDDYEDADISGYIKDSSSSSTLFSFYVNSSDDVKKGNASMDLDDLEAELNDDYYEFEDMEFEISLSGDEDEIVVKVYVDLDDYEDEWDDLTSSDKIGYLQDIVDRILDEDDYEDADISGYIKDSSSSSTLFSFYVNSSGTVKQD